MFGARLATVRLVAAFNVLESPVPTELLVEFFLILQYIEWLGQTIQYILDFLALKTWHFDAPEMALHDLPAFPETHLWVALNRFFEELGKLLKADTTLLVSRAAFVRMLASLVVFGRCGGHNFLGMFDRRSFLIGLGFEELWQTGSVFVPNEMAG